jgi:hypothetical protein
MHELAAQAGDGFEPQLKASVLQDQRRMNIFGSSVPAVGVH